MRDYSKNAEAIFDTLKLFARGHGDTSIFDNRDYRTHAINYIKLELETEASVARTDGSREGADSLSQFLSGLCTRTR